MAIRFLNSQSIDGELTVTENVGIGIATPDSPLHIWFDDNNAAEKVFLNVESGYGTDNPIFQVGTKLADGFMRLKDKFDVSKIELLSSGNSYFNGGNVGIGTTNPGHLLDVQAVTDPSIRVRSSGTGTSDDALVRIRIGGTTASSIITFGDSALSTSGQIRYTHSVDAMRLYTAGTEKMRIDSSGNVGIGTTNPDTELDVIGEVSVKPILYSANQDKFLIKGGASNATNWDGHVGVKMKSNAGGTPYLSLVGNNQETLNVISGKVGIGTANPIAKLYVDGGALGGTAGNEVALLSLKTTTNNTDTLQFTSERLSTGTDWTSAAQRIQRKIDTTLMGYMQFGSMSDDLITFGEGNTERMRIDGDGNVGIGTTNPSEKLEVVGNADISFNLFTGNNITARAATTQSSILELGSGRTGNGYAYIDLIGDATYSDYGLRIIRTNTGANTSSDIHHRGTGNLNIKTREAAPIVFQTTNAEKMRITAAGNVGIGTTNPIHKLDVQGNARVTGVLYADTGIYSDGYITADGNIRTYNDLQVDGGAEIGGSTGLGTSSPTQKLHVNGNARVTGAYYDSSNSPGTNGQVLSSTVTGTSWVTGGGGGGATSLNGLSDVLIDGTSSYFVNIPTTLSGNPAYNLVIGNGAGNSITTGNKNVILGQGAGNNVSTSISNVIIGYNAGQGLRTGSVGKNIIIGEAAGSALNQGYSNIMIGYRAGQSATQNSSVYIGYEAAKGSTGIAGIAIGYRAMYQASGGQRSTVVGYRTCYSTTGSFVEHTALGYDTLYSQTSGRLNTALGYAALRSGTTFTNNLGVGYKAGYSVTGTGNTLIGASSGFTGTNDLTSGSNNTLIGYSSASSSATVSNEFTLGNSSISTLRCAVTSITSLSDERDKAEIKDLTYGLDFIDSLQPREFIWNNRPEIKLEQVLDENNNEVFDENQEAVYEEVQFYSNNRGKKDFGFVAQEVQDLDDDTLRLVYDSNPDKLEMSYGKLVPILVKAIQELKAEIEALKSQ